MGKSFTRYLKMNCGIDLNEQQIAAVLHKDGPACTIAVPGAGKTTMMVCRTANLILSHGINPENIRSVTFSKASAIDMKKRFYSIFGSLVQENIEFSTIHSFAYSLVRENCYKTRTKLTVIEGEKSQTNKYKLLKDIYRSVNQRNITEDKLEELVNAIGYIKNAMIKINEIKDCNFKIDNLEAVYEKYENHKQQKGYIDYDDMLIMSYNILLSDPEALNKYRNKFKYMQVDEAQDISKIQNEIIKLLVYPKNNLFMVADDDQSIYGFRAACPRALLNFGKIYKNAKLFFMEENFRSSKNIVKICNDFIKTNTERYPKELKTRNKESEPIHIRQFKNEAEQLTSIANEIKKQDNLRDTAILYRNNISSIALADVFSREGIPFYLKEYKQVFFNHWVTQDIVAYLKFSLNNQDLESFNKIYYKLNAYISKSIIRYVSENNNNQSILTTIRNMPSLPNYILQHINELEAYFRTISRSEPEAAIKYIENCFGYKDYLKKNAKAMGYSLDNLLLIMSTLKLLAKESESIIEFLIRLTELEEIMTSAKFNKNKNAVVLSTIHSSKGLEFEKVFMIDLTNDQFPGTTSIDAYNEGNKSLLEEERRLFYVGMSRAKKQLSLYAPKYIDNEYKNCSLFVDEVRNLLGIKTQNKQMYKIGDIVQHIRFGRGKIIKSDEEYIDVYFYRYGNKKLSIDLCEKRLLLSHHT